MLINVYCINSFIFNFSEGSVNTCVSVMGLINAVVQYLMMLQTLQTHRQMCAGACQATKRKGVSVMLPICLPKTGLLGRG